MEVNRRNLKGKTAVLTGSTQGIGFAIARRLAQDGAHVIVSSRRAENVENAVKKLRNEGLKGDGIVCHVGKAEDRKKLVEYAINKTGGIDILVCCAGVNPHVGNFLDTSVEVWKKILDVNVISLFEMSKEVIPHLEKRNGGAILYISSAAAFNLMEEIGAYSISKTAVLGLTKVMALVCAQKNIRVNCMCPGLVKTDFSKIVWENNPHFVKLIPLGRFGEADECAGLAALLCSDDGSYITGENITIAGGFISHL